MKDNKLTIFAVIAMLCVGALLYYKMAGNKKRFSWFESYRADNSQPYGALFIRKLLEEYRTGEKFTLNTKQPLKYVLNDVENPERTDYVFIGQNMYLDSESTYAVAKFIEDGGNVFIASLAPPEQILSSVYYQECGVPFEYEYHRSASVDLNFYHPELRTDDGVTFGYRVYTTDVPYSWAYVREAVFCDSTTSVVGLGYQDTGRVNFVRIAIGKGNLYLHSNPLVFTNYFLTKPEKVDYASAVFSHLDGKDIIWDEFSKIPLPNNDNSYSSPLYYLLSQPSLKYAWWMLLATVGIYVLFAAKRRQRVIPIVEPKTNSSLEFVNMISGLHYKNGNHLDMAHKKMKYFLYFVRSKYSIHAERFSDEQIRRLAEKSRVPIADVELIFSRYYLIEERFKHNIEASRLMDLHSSIDNFYRQIKTT